MVEEAVEAGVDVVFGVVKTKTPQWLVTVARNRCSAVEGEI